MLPIREGIMVEAQPQDQGEGIGQADFVQANML